MFGYLTGLFSFDIGIDLGTANTLVYVKGQGIVLGEPSVVAVKKGTNHVYAVGEEAKRMLGRTPGDIVAVRPLKHGVIADFEVTEQMLRYFVRKVHERNFFVRPRAVIAVPSGITEVEKKAVKDSAFNAGCREVHLIEEPMAAAIGVGLPVEEPTGHMVIDIGGGTTEIAVISLAGIVHSRTLRVGGDECDEAIVQYMKKAHNMIIGVRTAEEIKIRIGSAYPLNEELMMKVKGRNQTKGVPQEIEVSSVEVREVLLEPVGQIVKEVMHILESTPPELSADLLEKGPVIAGGGALLRSLNFLISKETGLPVVVADDPLTSVVLGAGAVLDEIKLLRSVLRD